MKSVGELTNVVFINSVQAHTMTDSVFWTLDRESFACMEMNDPALCMLIQHSLLKSFAIATTCALYALHPATAYHTDIE